MAGIKTSSDQKKAVPPPAETTPAPSHHIDNGFIWQQLNEINRGIGRIESSIEGLGARVDKLETKTSSIKDNLNKIIWVSIGGGSVIAFIVSAILGLMKLFK